MKFEFKKIFSLKALAIILELFGLSIFIYIIILPFYPSFKYNLAQDKPTAKAEAKNLDLAKEAAADIMNNLPASEYAISPNRLIIKKIGVNSPIVESSNSDYGLSKGAWHDPKTSTPDKGGNTVLTGHRFKYFPPNNLTFYLLDKLEAGDIISLVWHEKDYFYKVKESKVVPAEDVSILENTKSSILTLYTCDPIYSTENRLVVVSELIE